MTVSIQRKRDGTRKPSEHAFSAATIDRIRRLCEVHSNVTVAEIVGIHPHTIGRLKKRGWRIGKPGSKKRPRPDDFGIMASRMSIPELMRHYRADRVSIREWLTGIERHYQPKTWDRSLPIPPRETIIEAIKGRKLIDAAKVLGVHPMTLQRWRVHHGLPTKKIRPKKAPRPEFGWAERYFEKAA